MTSDSLKARVTELLAQAFSDDERRARATSLWRDYCQHSGPTLPDEPANLFVAALAALLGQDEDEVAMRHDVDPADLVRMRALIRQTVDLSPFDPRYATTSPRVNPLMQQLAGLLFDVCERSHDPLEDARELPQIATTWTLLTLELPGPRGRDTLVSLVDNHTRFVLDQRLIDAGPLGLKVAVDILVSVMHKSGIRPDDVMIQHEAIADQLGERLSHIDVAWSLTDGSHLEALSASFAARFSEPEVLHCYFEPDPARLPAHIDALHTHTTRFWELRPWEKLGSEVMLDVASPQRSWLVSVLDARGGRLGFTLFDATEDDGEQVGEQQILALIGCTQIARPTLAALANAGYSPVGEDYFAMLITSPDHPARDLDFQVAASLCRALNAFVEAGTDKLTLEDDILGTLHISAPS